MKTLPRGPRALTLALFLLLALPVAAEERAPIESRDAWIETHSLRPSPWSSSFAVDPTPLTGLRPKPSDDEWLLAALPHAPLPHLRASGGAHSFDGTEAVAPLLSDMEQSGEVEYGLDTELPWFSLSSKIEASVDREVDDDLPGLSEQLSSTTGVSMSLDRAGWPIVRVGYERKEERGVAERPLIGGPRDAIQELATETAAVSMWWGGQYADLYLSSQQSKLQDLLHPEVEGTLVNHFASVSFRPLPWLSVAPGVGIGSQRYGASVLDSTAVNLSLSSSFAEQGVDVYAFGSYMWNQDGSGTSLSRNLDAYLLVEKSLKTGWLGLSSRESIALEAGYSRYEDLLVSGADLAMLNARLLFRIRR